MTKKEYNLNSGIDILNAKMSKKYVKSDGTICPFCDSKLIVDVSGFLTSTEQRGLFSLIMCMSCRKTWWERWVRYGIVSDFPIGDNEPRWTEEALKQIEDDAKRLFEKWSENKNEDRIGLKERVK